MDTTESRIKSCKVQGCTSDKYHAKDLCPMHYQRLRKTGELGEPDSKHGKGYIDDHGYRRVYRSDGSLTFEHRVVMEEFLGRRLLKTETVHHKNGNRLDNVLENLELWDSRHPKGQRVEDKINFALEILRQYKPEIINDEYL